MLKEEPFLRGKLKLNWIFFLTAGTVYAVAASFAVAHFEHFFDRSIYSFTYGFGPTTKALVETGSCRTFANGIAYTMHRFPLIPYFLYIIHFVTTNAFIALLIKNIFTGFIFSYVTFRIFRSWGKNVLFLLMIVFFSPQFVIHAFNIYHEEAFVSALLALISILLCTPQHGRKLSRDDILFSISSILLVFTKSSSIYLASALPVLWFIQRKSFPALWISGGVIASAFLTIALYSFILNGAFTLESSLNGVNIYKGNNSRTLELYPALSLDILDKIDPVITSPGVFSNEWEYNKYYKQKAYNFIKHHPDQFFKSVIIKTWALFLSIHQIGADPEREEKNKFVNTVDIVATILQRSLLCVVGLIILVLLFHSTSMQNRIIAMTALSFIILYSGPFLIGFGYMRHYVPLMFPVMIFGIKLYSCEFL